jgi:hypothetical protein
MASTPLAHGLASAGLYAVMLTTFTAPTGALEKPLEGNFAFHSRSSFFGRSSCFPSTTRPWFDPHAATRNLDVPIALGWTSSPHLTHHPRHHLAQPIQSRRLEGTLAQQRCIRICGLNSNCTTPSPPTARTHTFRHHVHKLHGQHTTATAGQPFGT